MNKLLTIIVSLMLVLALCVPALAETVDAVSSASVADFYGDSAMTGEELMNAINSFSGFYTITTADAEGNLNCGFFIYGMVEKDGEYYLQFGLAPNQTRENLVNTGKAVAVYAAAPTDKPYAVAGARMWCEIVTDEALLAELNAAGSNTALFFHVTAIRSLG